MPDDAPTATYVVTNEDGNILRTIPLVLGEVRQSGCETSGDDILLVEDSSELYPGMGVYGYQIPAGTFILAIKNATEVVLSQDAAGTTAGLVVCFKGYVSEPVSKAADRGWWRNLIYGTTSWDFKTSVAAHANPTVLNGPWTIVPKTFEPFLGAPLTYDVHKGDDLAAEPELRTKTEHWSFWMLVSTGGHISTVPFSPDHSLHLKELVAAT